jgi:hypothetical protein
MRFSRPVLSFALITITVAGCTVPETRRFAVEIDDGIYINNAVPIIDSVATPEAPGIYMGTVEASHVDCPQMPCNDDLREAREQAYWDFREAPEGVDEATF